MPGSATPLKIELARKLPLAVGGHSRLPRRYRGMDIMWWLDSMGLLERRIPVHIAPGERVGDPSAQLVGRPDTHDLDLPSLQSLSLIHI